MKVVRDATARAPPDKGSNLACGPRRVSGVRFLARIARPRIVIPRRRYQARYTNVTPAALFLECRKGGAGVGYVLGKQRRGWGGVRSGSRERASELETRSPREPHPPPPACVLLAPELSSAFQQLSEHLARVRDEGNKRQIALSTHPAAKAP